MRSRFKKQPGLLLVVGGVTGGLLGKAMSRNHRGSVALGVALGALSGAMGDYMLEMRRFDVKEPASSVQAVTSYLSRHLGEGVTAYLSGIDDPGLASAWAQGVAVPSAEQWERLQAAYEAALCLVDDCGDEMTRSWFFGMNTSLRETAPAYVLRHWSRGDWPSVVEAAQEFAEI